MNVLNLLVGLNSVILIFLVANVFKPLIGSYAAKKGENLATKEDIAQLTKIVEGIKADISDKVWDRQRQWEMRRDAVADVFKSLGPLNQAIRDFELAYRIGETQAIEKAFKDVGSCWDGFECSRSIADLVVGESLRNAMSECSSALLGGRNYFLMNDVDRLLDSMYERDRKINAVYAAARKELRIEDIDPVVALD
jgi:hypothetical protein